MADFHNVPYVVEPDDSFLQRVKRSFQDPALRRAGRHLGVGILSGILTCVVVSRVGKAAGAALGTSFIIIVVANHQGYITIDWDRVPRPLRDPEGTISRATRSSSGILANTNEFLKENMWLAVGFGAGFFMGLSL